MAIQEHGTIRGETLLVGLFEEVGRSHSHGRDVEPVISWLSVIGQDSDSHLANDESRNG